MMKELKFRQAALALAAAVLLSGQVHAGEAQVETLATQPVAAFTEADVQALFVQDAQPMQLAVLSQQEMMETEGAFWPAVVLWTAGGAALGSYTAWRQNGMVTWHDIGAGATAGFYASPFGRPFGNVGQFVMGGLGASSWYWHYDYHY